MWANVMQVSPIIQVDLCKSENFQQERWSITKLRLSVPQILTFLFQIRQEND